MERGRHPHVIRTWAVDRIRQHQAGTVKTIHPEGPGPKRQTPPQPKAKKK